VRVRRILPGNFGRAVAMPAIGVDGSIRAEGRWRAPRTTLPCAENRFLVMLARVREAGRGEVTPRDDGSQATPPIPRDTRVRAVSYPNPRATAEMGSADRC
jgi:hypothetical protein